MKPATAATPSDLSPRDLELVLALVRGHTLQEAGRRLGLDTSSVYRAVKKLEQRLGLPLFDRGRQGMAPGELALALAQRAEAIEAQLESARELLQDDTVALSGVRADRILTPPADPVLTRGWTLTARRSAVDKCRSIAGSSTSAVQWC